MTAEVAILNNNGVAFAADSMVSGSGGNGRSFDGVRKILPLSSSQPIGVMIYGSADLMGIPFASIVAAFRTANDVFPTLGACAEAFTSHLASFRAFSDEEKLENFRGVLRSSLQHYCQWARDVAFHFHGMSEDPFRVAANRILRARIAELGLRRHLPEGEVDAILVRYAFTVDVEVGMAKERFRRCGFPVELLRRLAASILRSDVGSPVAMGYVIAGFGTDDWAPRLRAFERDGWLGDSFKSAPGRDDVAIGMEVDAAIATFAQEGVTRRALLGADTRLMEMVRLQAATAIDVAVRAARKHYAPKSGGSQRKDDDYVDGLVLDVMRDFVAEIGRLQRRDYVEPMIGAVGMLSLPKMAAYARDLVASAVTDQEFAARPQSVGGTVDVAIMSRAEGFRMVEGGSVPWRWRAPADAGVAAPGPAEWQECLRMASGA